MSDRHSSLASTAVPRSVGLAFRPCRESCSAKSIAGPANIRLGLQQSFSAVLRATAECLRQAGLAPNDMARIVACLALAGASEPAALAEAQRYEHPFRKAMITTDARAACIGAHGGCDGGVLVVGTGTIGWAELAGRSHRVGGWGPAVSDEGGGAWLGCEALRRVLWALDGRIPWTPLLTAVFEQYARTPTPSSAGPRRRRRGISAPLRP